jgi:peptidyl-dipeptidase Dcp
MTENPLFEASTLPYQLPPFAEIRDEHFMPAFERGMTEHLAEIDAIVADPAPADFANTIGALERAGQLLDRVSTAFFTLAASHSTDAIQEVETEISPRLAGHGDTIHMNRALFDRIMQVEGGDAEESWVLERYRLDFTRAGAELSDADQERLRELNQELTKLSTTFRQSLLQASTDSALVVDDPALLDGLDDDRIAGLRQDDGSYQLPLLNFTNQPALAHLTDRETRRRLY